MSIRLPPFIQRLIGPSGRIDTHWERWFGDLVLAVNSASGTTPAPTPEPASFVIDGAGSISADGSVESGAFSVSLENDKDNPPPNSFYGADTTGTKGFVPVYDALEEGVGIALHDSGYVIVDTVGTPDDLPLTGNAGEAVRVTESEPGVYAWGGAAFTLDPAATGIVNVALAPLADAGTGTALKKIVRDAYGRVSATETANAIDLPYSNATSGLAATDTQAAIDEVAAKSVTGSWTTIKKTTDQSRSSTTTLADDSTLKVSLLAATRYCIRARIFYGIANATMDFKYNWVYSGTTTSLHSRKMAYSAGATAGTDTDFANVEEGTIAVSQPLSAAGGTGYFELNLVILTNTAGTLSLQWAQNTSDAGNATVYAGSYLEYMTV